MEKQLRYSHFDSDTSVNNNSSGGCFSCFFSCCGRMKRKEPKNRCLVAAQKVPYHQELPEQVTAGTGMIITGKSLPNCQKFAVNLICDCISTDTPDIALHFNPRLSQRYIVRNCQINGRWGEEETTLISKFDIEEYRNFQLLILVAGEEFLVSLNGKHLCAFGFRLPLEKVKFLEVVGNVQVLNVDYKKLTVYPEITDSTDDYKISLVEGDYSFKTEGAVSLNLPITGILSKKFGQGWQLNIIGKVKLLPHSFYINLQVGRQIWPHPIIPLHLNPRFATASGDNIIVRNAWVDGGWGPEERIQNFNFIPGCQFKLTITCDMDGFSVWIDENLTGEFRLRCKSDEINTVYIQGDVHIYHIYMEKERRSILSRIKKTNTDIKKK